jgi:RimJ/RimL family protein N-acetyltransferase
MPSVEFTPVTHADIPLLRSWMLRPHVRMWWGDPDEELDDIVDMIEGRETTEPYIFHVEGKPAGYIQVWHLAPQLNEKNMVRQYPWICELPHDAVGVDITIGAPEDTSRGIGTAVLTQFISMLLKRGHRTIVIDPDPANARAIRAYEKAGFKSIPQFVGRFKGVLLMQYQGTS